MSGPTARRDELAAGLAAVHHRVATACERAGRDPAEVHVTVVTKTFPPDDVRLLAALGVTDVGENRQQEAGPKAAELADLGLAWHFVGGLQSNKAAAVTAYADVVESVDRVKLVRPLARGASEHGRVVRCLVQVSLDPPGSRDAERRGGAAPDDVRAVAEALAAADGLVLGGVMAVAPRDGDPRTAFDRLVAVAQRLRVDHPGATWVSAGMSADLEAAVEAGATHVRPGSAVLGARPAVQ